MLEALEAGTSGVVLKTEDPLQVQCTFKFCYIALIRIVMLTCTSGNHMDCLHSLLCLVYSSPILLSCISCSQETSLSVMAHMRW